MEKLAEANMISDAWKFHEHDKGIDYRLQFTEVPWKFRKALFEAMTGWDRVAVGWTKDTGNQIFIFNKRFNNQNDWETWADKFPVQIREKRIWGDKEKVVIHGKKKTK